MIYIPLTPERLDDTGKTDDWWKTHLTGGKTPDSWRQWPIKPNPGNIIAKKSEEEKYPGDSPREGVQDLSDDWL